MTYNARLKKNRRTLNTRQALQGLFGNRKHKPCSYCGKMLSIETATFDHVRALSAGGYDKRKNGAIACHQCNQQKRSMSAEQFRNLKRGRGKNDEAQ